MRTFRRIAAAVVMSGALVTGGLVAAASPASADVGVQMYIQWGPFNSYDACEIHRRFNDNPTTPCEFYWDDRHPIGYYYGEYS
jgi:hypothetical protein